MKLKKIYEEVMNARKDMPQVGANEMDSALKILIDNGIDVEKSYMKVKDMKSSQKEIIDKKKKSIAKDLEFSHLKDMKPIVVSIDNFIVDGHHRKFAIEFLKREYERCPIIRIMLPQKEAIDIYKQIEELLGEN